MLPDVETTFWCAALPLLARVPGQYLRLSTLDADNPATVAWFEVLREQSRPHYRTRDYARAVLHACR